MQYFKKSENYQFIVIKLSLRFMQFRASLKPVLHQTTESQCPACCRDSHGVKTSLHLWKYCEKCNMGTGTQENFEPLKWGHWPKSLRTPASKGFEKCLCSVCCVCIMWCLCVLGQRFASHRLDCVCAVLYQRPSWGRQSYRNKCKRSLGNKNLYFVPHSVSVKSSHLTDMFLFVGLESCLSGRIFCH